jgi:ABC-type nitrate/sulfonate/bicarbonate transport system permease component
MPPSSTREVGAGLRTTAAQVAPAALSLLAVLVGWQACVTASDVPPVVLPSPIDVFEAGITSWRLLLGDAVVTASTAALGLFIGGSVGLLVAFVSTGSETVEGVVYPYLVAIRIAPLVAIAPLLFLWLGDGLLARAVLVATLTVFPVAVASLDGLRSTPRRHIDLLRTVDAPPSRVFRSVRLPAAIPSVLAGVKLAAALSVVGAVVAEFLAFDGGLGYRVFNASSNLRTPRLFAALFVLVALGLGFYLPAVALERRPGWTINA